jgi:hypothetical protein
MRVQRRIAVVVAALLLVSGCGDGEEPAVRVQVGGPLERAEFRNGSSVSFTARARKVRQPIYFGMVVLDNRGPDPATIDRIELVEPSDNAQLAGVFAVGADREVAATSEGEWPPPPSDFKPGSWRPARGTVVPPKASPEGRIGVELLLVLDIPRRERYSFRAVRIEYRVADRRYWIQVPYSLVVCADAVRDCPSVEPLPRKV